MYNLFLTHHTHSWPGRRPRRPTAANEGQHRPTKTKKGPNHTRRVVWAIGTSFFGCTFLFLFFRPTAAKDSQQRPTQAHKDRKGPKPCQTRCLGHRYVIFLIYIF